MAGDAWDAGDAWGRIYPHPRSRRAPILWTGSRCSRYRCRMQMPVIVAVDEDDESLGDVERELADRYARSYRIVTASSAGDGIAELVGLASSGEDVALVLVGLSLGPDRSSKLLQRARALHPRAQRGLIIELSGWGDTKTGRLILNAMARREIDYYAFRPTRSPDEVFHQSISNFLLEWTHARRISTKTVHIIGESWTGRAYELRQVLGRCAVPHAFHLADSPDGRARIEKHGQGVGSPARHPPGRERPRGSDQPRAGVRDSGNCGSGASASST